MLFIFKHFYEYQSESTVDPIVLTFTNENQLSSFLTFLMVRRTLSSLTTNLDSCYNRKKKINTFSVNLFNSSSDTEHIILTIISSYLEFKRSF